MKYHFGSYMPFISDGFLEKYWQVINWIFVDVPFFIFRLLASIVLLAESVLDQSQFFVDKQTDAFDISVKLLNQLGGTAIAKGSLLALVFLISAYYLLFQFFSARRNFSKVVLQYLAVFLVFVFWFGKINTPSGTQNGGTFLISSANQFADSIKKEVASVGSLTQSGTTSDNSSLIFDATVGQTFNFVNSGSLDGKMENGEKLDYKKLLMPITIKNEEKKDFIETRKKYIKDNVENNPYFEASGDKIMEKDFAILVGTVNLGITAFPALYVNAMTTIVQVVVDMIIIVFPLLVFFALFPKFHNVLFKSFKSLIGLLFLPVLLAVFLAIYFWINSSIDTAFMNLVKLLSPVLVSAISGAIVALSTIVILVVVKVLLLRFFWKRRYDLLGYFSDNQIEMPAFEQTINQKASDFGRQVVNFGTNTAEVAIGAYTGNPAMIADGVTDSSSDNGKDLNKEDFIDNEHEDNSSEDKGLYEDLATENDPIDTPDFEVIDIDDEALEDLELHTLALDDMDDQLAIVDLDELTDIENNEFISVEQANNYESLIESEDTGNFFYGSDSDFYSNDNDRD
ncbi:MULTISPECIES: hypothetical protein [unclassified Enterococcus]|uniref:hypothetical protein n=1 Tax=unclassified Enterococcus TaxID=2608891 RepID=UPI0015565EF5|nr:MULTISPECIES: hypothetical protein [unclassified Enterococcus]MBS7576971.1 hypothetical protein [Enterococcus sp. MMGLQ5-2]MBS7584378.1 hypothetical protein [Enterococcus sp. MMGLQ5-1]NPD12233.1 hypothetical protein [Enterococcus sp. MMGLQ5-1]NPD36805.1 hypothetical protein [Enterococcus sp. MMGLQ5-2]